MKIVSKEEMKNIDKLATKQYQIPSLILMENAGEAVYDYIREHINDYLNKRFLIICGTGNNGGDGAVVARKLFLDDIYVRVIFLSDHEKSTGDKKTNFDIVKSLGVPIDVVENEQDLKSMKPMLMNYDVVIDAIFGISFHGDVDDFHASVIQFINAFKSETECANIIAVDIPTGVYADGGIANYAVKADTTVTFGLPKLSMFDYPAREFIGERYISHINLPRELLKNRSLKNNLLMKDYIQKLFIKRSRNSHKGHYGHLLIVGGSPNFSGALVLAAQAALTLGAGLVTVAVPESVRQSFSSILPEAMVIPLEYGNTTSDVEVLRKFIDERTPQTVLIGNGWGVGDYQADVMKALMENEHLKNFIIDADGLNILAKYSKLLPKLIGNEKNVVLTPHIKEMSRLIERSTNMVKNLKVEIARDYAVKNHLTLVLKDTISRIAFSDGQVWFNEYGSAALAKGGSGDILAGMIAGLITSGYSTETAALMGSYLLGRVGEIYECKFSAVTPLARDLIATIPEAVAELEEVSYS